MELCSDHIVIETNSHYRSLIWNMGTVFLYAQQSTTHFPYQPVIRLNNLVVAAVDGIKWIVESVKYRLRGTVANHMNGENTKRS